MTGLKKIKELWPSTCHDRWMEEKYAPGLVSVIIPTYNRASMVVQAMESVWLQSYRPLEMLVVDDGSNDDTARAIEKWGNIHAGDSRFTLHYLFQENKDAPAARNLGLIESKGEYIQFLDSDDILGTEKIKTQLGELVKHPPGTAAYGPSRLFNRINNGYTVFNLVKTAKGNPLQLWLSLDFTHPHTILWQRSDLIRLGPWDESLKADQDGDYGIRFLLAGGKFILCPSAWSYYQTSYLEEINEKDNVGSRSTQAAFMSRIKVTSKAGDFLQTHNQLSPKYRKAIALRYCRFARHFAAENNFPLALVCFKKIWKYGNLRYKLSLPMELFFCSGVKLIVTIVPRKSLMKIRRRRHRMKTKGQWKSGQVVHSIDKICNFDNTN